MFQLNPRVCFFARIENYVGLRSALRLVGAGEMQYDCVDKISVIYQHNIGNLLTIYRHFIRCLMLAYHRMKSGE
jgi:hypothetical protein